MKLTKCEKHKGTFLASDDTLLMILAALMTDPNIQIWKVERCDVGGWHIYIKKR